MAHRAKKPKEGQLSLQFDRPAAPPSAAPAPEIHVHIHIHGTETTSPQVTVDDVPFSVPEQNNRPPKSRVAYARPHLIPPKAERPDPLITAPPYPKVGTSEYDAHRVYLRDHLRYENRRLSGEFRRLGGSTNIQFSVFYREGMQGLYNNQDTRGLARQRKIKMKEFWERTGIAELTVNLDRVVKTREALEDLKGRDRTREIAMNEHHRIGRSLRAAFRAAHDGYAPERLPAHPPLKEARQRIRTRAAEVKAAARAAVKAEKAAAK
jgi:hypothetical protein